jgi:hypothetical protein
LKSENGLQSRFTVKRQKFKIDANRFISSNVCKIVTDEAQLMAENIPKKNYAAGF